MAVVGGGLAGLSAALELTERGYNVCMWVCMYVCGEGGGGWGVVVIVVGGSIDQSTEWSVGDRWTSHPDQSTNQPTASLVTRHPTNNNTHHHPPPSHITTTTQQTPPSTPHPPSSPSPSPPNTHHPKHTPPGDHLRGLGRDRGQAALPPRAHPARRDDLPGGARLPRVVQPVFSGARYR